MPVSTSKELVPFVNQLEEEVVKLFNSIQYLQNQISGVDGSIMQINAQQDQKINQLRTAALSAIVRAEEASNEINNATFGTSAVKGQRLKTLLDQLKTQVNTVQGQIIELQGTTSRPYFLLTSSDLTVWKITIGDDGALESDIYAPNNEPTGGTS